ncbi:hypothetical protein [Pedobacter nutrimenti]|uniref:Carboxypeptidase-like protein n=1 Tax=Pedobacter nutrimenti TaxID=1241337 RepID=A0A318UIQ0_9SPHI|nr:hypothetical protein [Pedobacter nutrimenti]PYF75851.1 hypothetical protein B0O44_102405 [Pedobacter nutrimenti]
MKFTGILLFFLFPFFAVFAQQKTVQGFVVDKSNNQRLAKVYIYNSRTDEGLYNTNKGEFSTQAMPGDTLFAALAGYAVDTLIYKGQNSIYFQLNPLSIRLKEVKIFGGMPSPKQQHEKTLKEYKYALDRGSSKDLLNLGQNGVGLGIDAIYNLLSRKGANARHLQKILERDYHEQIIDFRFRPDYVERILNIHNFELTDFMQQYRPTYEFVLSASDYAFVVFIRNNYITYKRNPKALRLQPLPTVQVETIKP